MQPTLRILALNWRCLRHPQAGGAETCIFEQAQCWARDGHNVTVVTADPGRRYAPERDEQWNGVIIKRMGGRFSLYLLVALFLLRYGRRFDCVLDISNGIPFFTPLFGRLPGVLFVHHVHHKQWFVEMPWPLGHVGWFLESKVVPWLYRTWPVIAVSPTTRQALIELGMTGTNIHIVYSGLVPPPPPEPRPARRDGQIVYLGRIKRYKRVDMLVRIVARLRSAIPDIRLDIAGDGDERAEVERLVAELDVGDLVTIHGFVDEATKAELLWSARAFVTASMHEGWGLSVVEANACGCPAVAFNVPGLSVAIRHRMTGLLAETEDDMQQAIAALLCDRGAWTQMAEGAQQWARQFSWASAASTTLLLLRGVVPAERRLGRPSTL
ncbi:MAG: glycosyltransferase family 4 protein [Chloroflexaceae bacterium]|jgi:glycosyltransferase involved in cell wall biosynthesis|nr:glycosyltransferase family 4 protein [Chloroflexaceae bacterium]